MLTAVSTIPVLSLNNLVPEKSPRINISNVSIITEVCDMIVTEGKNVFAENIPIAPLRNRTGQEYLHQNHYPMSMSIEETVFPSAYVVVVHKD